MPETPSEHLTDWYWSRENALARLRAIDGNREKIEQWNDQWNNYLQSITTEGGMDESRLPIWSSKNKPANLCSDPTHPFRLSFYDPDEDKHIGIDLRYARLDHAFLSGVRLDHAFLSGVRLDHADLSNAHLEDANLSYAHLQHAYLAKAHLEYASLDGAHLEHAIFKGTHLEHAYPFEAHLEYAILIGAHIEHADLRGADLRNTNVTGVIYDRGGMRGKYLGVRGLDSCYGNALFKRDAQDQDYIDTLEALITNRSMRLKDRRRVGKIKWGRVFSRNHCRRYLSVKAERVKRYRVRPALFRAWGWIDYGRNIEKVAVGAVGLAMMFGIIFWIDWIFGPCMLNYKNAAKGTGTLLTPFYYSIVTYTTLGFGDVTPNNLLGESLVIIEVILGYTTLGLLISILANKVARRA